MKNWLTVAAILVTCRARYDAHVFIRYQTQGPIIATDGCLMFSDTKVGMIEGCDVDCLFELGELPPAGADLRDQEKLPQEAVEEQPQ